MVAEWRRKRERKRHFKEKMSLEEAHHHRRPWIRAWRKKEEEMTFFLSYTKTKAKMLK